MSLDIWVLKSMEFLNEKCIGTLDLSELSFAKHYLWPSFPFYITYNTHKRTKSTHYFLIIFFSFHRNSLYCLFLPFRPYYHGYPMVRGSLIKSQSMDFQSNSSHGRKWPEIEKEHKNKAYAVNTITCTHLCVHLQIWPSKFTFVLLWFINDVASHS